TRRQGLWSPVDGPSGGEAEERRQRGARPARIWPCAAAVVAASSRASGPARRASASAARGASAPGADSRLASGGAHFAGTAAQDERKASRRHALPASAARTAKVTEP